MNANMRWILALIVLGAAGASQAPAADDNARNLRLLKHDNEFVRERAARALGKAGNKQAVVPLTAALKDKSANVRRAAAAALGNIDDAGAFEAVRAAMKDPSAPVRRAACAALGKLGGKAAVPPLLAALKAEAEFRAKAVKNMRTASPGKREDFFRSERDAEQFEEIIVDALALIGPAAVEPLKAYLNSKDDVVRGVVLRALHKLDWKPSTTAEQAASLIELGKWDEVAALGAPAIRPLLKVLNTSIGDYRRHEGAAGALRRIKGKAVVGPLAEALKDKSLSRSTRMTVAHMLAAAGSDAVKPLLAALKEGDQVTVALAAGALGELKDKRAIAPLVKRLRNSPGEARRRVALALEEFGWEPATDADKAYFLIAHDRWGPLVRLGPVAVDPLLAALETESPYGQASIVGALGDIGDKRCVDALLSILRTALPSTRAETARLKAEGYDNDFIRRMLADLGEVHQRVRAAAARALAKLDAKEAVDPLLAVLGNGTTELSWAATQSLGELGDARAVEPIIALLKSKDARARAAAVTALGKLADARAVGPLVAALHDSYRDVRKQAMKTLAELRAEEAVEPLLALAEDGDVDAILALGELGDRRAVQPLIAIANQVRKEVPAPSPAAPYGRGARYRRRVPQDQEAALQALGKLGDKRAYDTILKRFRSDDPEWQAIAAKALGELGDERTFDLLVQATKSDEWRLQRSAYLGLAALKDPRSFDIIAALLGPGQDALPSTAAQAFERLGDKRAIPLLTAALADRQGGDHVVKALKKLGWTPKTDTDRVYCMLATRNHRGLRDYWPTAMKILLADCRSSDKWRVRSAVEALMSYGGQGGAEALSELFAKHPTLLLAKALLDGRTAAELQRRAREWLRKQGQR